MHSALRDLLQEPVPSVLERENTTLERLLRERQNRVVLFGAGTLGRRAFELLRGLGVNPLALTDNNAAIWGSVVDGRPVLSPADAAKMYGADAIFFVTVWNDHHWYSDTFAMLTSHGCKYVSTYAPIFWRFPDTFLTLTLLNEPPHRLYAQARQVLQAEHVWADETSADIYRANIRWRAVGDAAGLPKPPEPSTYFPADIFALSSHDVLLDCGAFDGDTIRQVIARRNSDFGAIHSIEADEVSFDNLKAQIAKLAHAAQGKIHLHRCAVGEERGVVRFACSGSLTSKISEDGEGAEVDCVPIDDLFADTPVTMIKMDIEGAEHGALIGGRKTIERDKPTLAICVYHTQNDIWRIPLLIREMLPEHRLYLRAYEGDGFQTVAYAVPPGRALSI